MSTFTEAPASGTVEFSPVAESIEVVETLIDRVIVCPGFADVDDGVRTTEVDSVGLGGGGDSMDSVWAPEVSPDEVAVTDTVPTCESPK